MLVVKHRSRFTSAGAWRTLLLVAALAVSPAAFAAGGAADTEPPVITCNPPDSVPPGHVKLKFTITDQSALFGVLFHWRLVGETNFRQVDFPSGGPNFTAEFDANKPFEFWIEAYDEQGNGPALFGSSDAPKRVAMTAPATTTPPPPAMTATPQPPPAQPFEQINATQPAAPKPTPKPAEALSSPDNMVRSDQSAPAASGPMRTTEVMRVFTGRALPLHMFQARANADFSFGGDFLYPGASESGQAMNLALSYQALDFLAVGLDTSFGRASLSSATANTGSAWPLSASTGTDFGLNARLTSGPLGIARLGLVASVDLPAAAPGSDRAASPGLLAVATIDTPQVKLHFNAGYKWDNSENTLKGTWSGFDAFALGVSRYDDLRVALAAEVPFNQVVPYAEWALDVPVNRRRFASCDGVTATATCSPNPSLFPASGWQIPQRLGLGVRYEISSLIGVDAGLEISLTRAGRGYSDATSGSLMPLEGLPPPPPFAARLRFIYQFGAPPSPDETPGAATAPHHTDDQDNPF